MEHGNKEASASDRGHSDTSMHQALRKDPNREGGLRASLALLGAFCALFCSVGLVNAFGVFQEYYKANQLRDKSEFDISWIGSFSSFVLFAGAVPAGIVVDKIGPTIPMTAGSIFLLLGIFMTSLCNEYWQFFLAQAVVLGLGFAFVLTPAVATIPRYWKRNRALAMGITIAGSSTGGIIWPIALNNLLNRTSIGFGWTLRIIGFVMIPLLTASCLTVRLPLPVPKEPSSIEEKAGASVQPNGATEKSDAKAKAPLLKNPSFLLLCTGLATLYLGFFGPFFYVSSYSVSLGQSSSFSFYLISILNGASFLGRVLPGFLADRYGPWNLLMISTFLSALVAFCWTAATSVAGVVVWSMAYGFASGAILSLQTTCAVSLARMEDHGKAIGMIMGSVALTGLFGTPICGQLLSHYGYLSVSMYTGASLVAAGVLVTVARLRLDRRILAVR